MVRYCHQFFPKNRSVLRFWFERDLEEKAKKKNDAVSWERDGGVRNLNLLSSLEDRREQLPAMRNRGRISPVHWAKIRWTKEKSLKEVNKNNLTHKKYFLKKCIVLDCKKSVLLFLWITMDYTYTTISCLETNPKISYPPRGRQSVT